MNPPQVSIERFFSHLHTHFASRSEALDETFAEFVGHFVSGGFDGGKPLIFILEPPVFEPPFCDRPDHLDWREI
jgi:hypothetical protein